MPLRTATNLTGSRLIQSWPDASQSALKLRRREIVHRFNALPLLLFELKHVLFFLRFEKIFL